MHDQRLSIQTAAVDNTTEDESRNGRPVRIPGDRNLQPMPVADHLDWAYGGAVGCVDTGIIALPRAGQSNVAKTSLLRANQEWSPAVRNVMPHQPARFGQVGGHGQDVRGDVPNLAVRVFAQIDVLDDGVQWVARV